MLPKVNMARSRNKDMEALGRGGVVFQWGIDYSEECMYMVLMDTFMMVIKNANKLFICILFFAIVTLGYLRHFEVLTCHYISSGLL